MVAGEMRLPPMCEKFSQKCGLLTLIDPSELKGAHFIIGIDILLE